MAKGRRRPGIPVGSAEFKARCLELVDHVKESHAEYIVTRHGEPVAKLTPVPSAAASSAVGSMRGTLVQDERPFDPIPAVWSVDQDDRE